MSKKEEKREESSGDEFMQKSKNEMNQKQDNNENISESEGESEKKIDNVWRILGRVQSRQKTWMAGFYVGKNLIISNAEVAIFV